MGLTYKDAGVDIDVEDSTIENLVGQFSRKGGLMGHFTGLIEFGEHYLSMCTDGVGSKVEVANALQKWDTVGIDCVAMNANDLICIGAKPLAFVDYLALERHDMEFARQIGTGLNMGAEMAGLSIVGGETATLPGIINGFDLAGTCLGSVEKKNLITGENLEEGDILVGMASSGVHSNGYSLVRKILQACDIGYDDPFPYGSSWGEVLLSPTRVYVKPILELLNKHAVKGMAHITGGGLWNVHRMNKDFSYDITDPMLVHSVFSELQKLGSVDNQEMYQTFNMGMGFVVAVDEDEAQDVVKSLFSSGETAKIVGRVSQGKGTRHIPLGLEYM